MNKFSPNKQLILNLSSALVVFFVNAAINFFLSPFIVERLGIEANGFILLANNIISYLTIITMALNSMSSRFITVAIYEKNYEKANDYYSSTFIGNIIILLALLIPVIMGIIFLDQLIDIPIEILNQVRLLFVFVFLNYFISTSLPLWGIAFFSTNNMHFQSFGNIITYSIRAIIIVTLFVFFPAQIWYVGIATVFSTIAMQVWLYKGKVKLLNELRIKRASMKFKVAKELIASGIWNSINQLGVVLFYGIDLIITNIMIGSEEMGMVALAKIIPNILISLQSTINKTFTPNLTILYAQGKISEIVKEIFKAGKILLLIMGIPFSAFVIFGEIFFTLWMPEQNSYLLRILSTISVSGLVFLLGVQPVWQIFVVVNKNKPNSLTVIYSGVVNLILTLVVLHYTDWGIFAVLGISSIISLLRNMIFVIPFSAIYLGKKWTTFFPLVGLTCLTIAINYVIGMFLMSIFTITTWVMLLGVIAIFTVISIIINSLVVLNKSERMYFLNRIIKRIVTSDN